MDKKVFELDFYGRKIVVEHGQVAKQADGAVLVRYGDTVVLSTAVVSKSANLLSDFFPLMVLYQEKLYSVGKIPGGFIKREGRPTDAATLAARMIDRPLRPLFPEDFKIKTVSEFCAETKSGSTPSRTNNEYWENGTISWVKSGEVHNNITLQTEEYITSLGLSESSTKLLPKDTVLMAMYGVTAGEVGYLAIEATTNQAICGMICRSKAEAAYLYFSLIQSQAAISRLSNGGAQDNLSKNFIDNIKIVVPPSEFIEKLNLAAIVEQMTLNTKEITLLEELQATVLAQLSSR